MVVLLRLLAGSPEVASRSGQGDPFANQTSLDSATEKASSCFLDPLQPQDFLKDGIDARSEILTIGTHEPSSMTALAHRCPRDQWRFPNR